jgi:hypothetical protein
LLLLLLLLLLFSTHQPCSSRHVIHFNNVMHRCVQPLEIQQSRAREREKGQDASCMINLATAD